MPDLRHLQSVLQQHQAKKVFAEKAFKKAAVASIFQERADGLEVLFIRRAEHPKDPWSGHMAFPGGRVDAGDSTPLSAAVRETQEEVGLDLSSEALHIGELSHITAIAHGKPLPMVIYPYVFSLRETPQLELDTREVQEALWVPLAFLQDPGNRKSIRKNFSGVPVNLPCYYYEGRIIWGLTLKMLDELMGALKY